MQVCVHTHRGYFVLALAYAAAVHKLCARVLLRLTYLIKFLAGMVPFLSFW